MVESLSTQAEALATALEIGAVSVADVVAWADSMIEQEEQPDWSLCELALCRNKYPPDVVSLLRCVPGSPEIHSSRALVISWLLQSLREHPIRADQIARALFELASAGELEDPGLRKVAWWAWDALDLADAGLIQETRAEVVRSMEAALLSSIGTAGVEPG